MVEVPAEDEASGEGDRDALERLRVDLPLKDIGRSPPHRVERFLQIDKIALDRLDRDVTLRVTVGSIHHDTHAACRLSAKPITGVSGAEFRRWTR
jgi:hypothetical protein